MKNPMVQGTAFHPRRGKSGFLMGIVLSETKTNINFELIDLFPMAVPTPASTWPSVSSIVGTYYLEVKQGKCDPVFL